MGLIRPGNIRMPRFNAHPLLRRRFARGAASVARDSVAPVKLMDASGDIGDGLSLITKEEKIPKEEFRYICHQHINFIRNIDIPEELPIASSKEAVLIEYRVLPHIEFLVRNAIHKLGSEWCFTIICGTLNFTFMKEMANSIHPSIRVILTPFENLYPSSSYNIFLASEDFWNLLHGEHILIYQEDSLIFNKWSDDFLEWDYIGAPWQPTQDDAPLLVGNGGFSLRKKSVMLEVIRALPITKAIPNKSTREYMTTSGLSIVPEDVYFSKTMQEFSIGCVAPVSIASRFSMESVYSETCFGGHNFWLADPKWRTRIIPKMRLVTNVQTTHRGGWGSVLNKMSSIGILTNNKDATYVFLSMVEEIYLWKNAVRPIGPWIGVVHCTPVTPEYLNNCNISFLVANTAFKEDLKNCRILFTLCDYVTDYLRDHLPETTRIVTLRHPVETLGFPLFTMKKWLSNPSKKLIQVGQQLRKVTSIYVVNLPPGFERKWLTGNPNIKDCNSLLERERSYLKLRDLPRTCPPYYTKSIAEYDALLSENVVFADLFDSAANNTVLECIARNTPIIINKTPGVVEYLGPEYPLYFDTLDDVAGLLDEDKVRAAHMYLLKMDKSRFTLDRFVHDIINEIVGL